MKDDQIYIRHMLDALERAESFLDGYDAEALNSDQKTRDATILQIALIGEEANKVSDEWKRKHSDIPWRKIIGMRNVLLHRYRGVETEIIWKTYKESFPDLKSLLKKYLQK